MGVAEHCLERFPNDEPFLPQTGNNTPGTKEASGFLFHSGGRELKLEGSGLLSATPCGVSIKLMPADDQEDILVVQQVGRSMFHT